MQTKEPYQVVDRILSGKLCFVVTVHNTQPGAVAGSYGTFYGQDYGRPKAEKRARILNAAWSEKLDRH